MLWTDLIYWWNHFLMAGWECFYVYLAVSHMQLTPIKTQIYFCSLFSLLMVGLFYREMCVKDPNLLSAVHKAGGWSEARSVVRARLRLDLKLSDDVRGKKVKKKKENQHNKLRRSLWLNAQTFMAVLIIHAQLGESQRPNVLVLACAPRVTLTMSL